MEKKILATNAEGHPWKWEEDGMVVTRSHARTAPGCHDSCGILTYVKDGKVVKVEGDPENPFNQGRLCPRCLAVTDVLYSEDRLLYPMVRDPKDRGKDAWKRVSWDEALDVVEREFRKVWEEYGPESIIYGQGTGRDINAYILHLAYAMQSPNWTCTLNGHCCYIPRINAMINSTGATLYADFGQTMELRYKDPRYTAPKVMIIWANNPVNSGPDGMFPCWPVDLMKLGTKLVVVDPRLTWLAAHAEVWLQIRPGTDGALALGMLNVIISEDLYDHEFVEKWCYGFDELAERAAEYPVEKTSDITWIPKEKIVEAARLYANAKPASIQWGLKVDMAIGGVEAALAIMALWSITGNVDIPGGQIVGKSMMTEPVPWQSTIGGDMKAIKPEQYEKGLGWDKYPMYKSGFSFAVPNSVEDAILTGKPYPIKAAWFQTTNALACMGADLHKWDKALSSIPFQVYVDLFMTPSIMKYADVFLPACTYLERNGSAGIAHYYLGGAAINKAIEPLGESLPDAEINLRVGKRFNPELWPWKDWDDWNRTELRGISWEELQAAPYIYTDWEYRKHEKGMNRPDGKPGFFTPTGRIELWSTNLKNFGYDPLPEFVEPEESPYNSPELAKEYPLVLATGARNIGFFHSEHRNIPRLRRLHPDPIVEMHPDTAKAAGIADGEWCMVENQRGKVKMRAKLTIGIDPRVVQADHGWWFPEGEREDLFGVFKSNINVLLSGNQGKTGFGSDFSCLLCRVRKLEEGE